MKQIVIIKIESDHPDFTGKLQDIEEQLRRNLTINNFTIHYNGELKTECFKHPMEEEENDA